MRDYRRLLQPRPNLRYYRAEDGVSIPNPLFLFDLVWKERCNVTVEAPRGREPWRQAKPETED